jgi:uncharacterized protein
MLPGRIPSTQVADFAARGVSMTESFRARQFGRLAASIAPDSGYDDRIEVTCSFAQGPEGYPEVAIRITGQMGLVCQRCLAPVRWDVDTGAQLTIVGAEREVSEVSHPFDSISMQDGVLDLAAAIEDEILSAMPLAPVHAGGPACAEVRVTGTEALEERAPANRPFAALRELIGRTDTDNLDRATGRRGEK